MKKEIPHLYKKLLNQIQEDIKEHDRKKKEIDSLFASKFRLNKKDFRKAMDEIENKYKIKLF